MQSTYDAATSIDDLSLVTVDIAESKCEITDINKVEAPYVPRSVYLGDTAALGERANSKWARISDEMRN